MYTWQVYSSIPVMTSPKKPFSALQNSRPQSSLLACRAYLTINHCPTRSTFSFALKMVTNGNTRLVQDVLLNGRFMATVLLLVCGYMSRRPTGDHVVLRLAMKVVPGLNIVGHLKSGMQCDLGWQWQRLLLSSSITQSQSVAEGRA